MIIPKSVLAISKILVSNDPFSYNFVAIKRSGDNLIAYATNGFVGIKVTFPEFNGEDYPYIDGIDYSSEHGETPIALEKDTCMQLMKMAKKSQIPIINNTILIDEKSFDSDKEKINAIFTDLDNTSKISVKCEDGRGAIESLESCIESFPTSADSCKEVGFDPFLVNDVLLAMCEILGFTRKNSWAFDWVQPIDKFNAIVLRSEKNDIEVEAFVMPKIK